MRRRYAFMAIGLLGWTVLMVPVGTAVLALLMVPPWGEDGAPATVDALRETLTEERWWGYGLLVCGVVTLSQLLFLVPVVRLRPPQGARPKPLAVSVATGALIAAGVTLGLALALAELLGTLAGPAARPWPREMLDAAWVWPGMLVVLAGSWLGWTMLLLVFSRQLWADRVLGRFSVVLFAGTVVELLVVLPVDVMVRRRSECYCMTGTFLSLVLSAVAIVWLAGPGVVFALTASRRRLARRTHCAGCGHPKGPSPGERCPECGFGWGGASP